MAKKAKETGKAKGFLSDNYTRVSPGVYKNTATGKTVQSTTNPAKAASKPAATKKPAKQKEKPTAGQTAITEMQPVVDANKTAISENAELQDYYNRPDQYNPYGSQVINEDGSMTTALSDPEQQKLANSQNTDISMGNLGYNLTNQLGNSIGQPMDFSTLGAMPMQNGFDDFRNRVETTLTDRFAKRNDPLFAKQSEDFEQQMANRGIPVGSKLYNDQKQQLMNQQQDARDAATAQAVQLGNQEAQSAFGMSMQQRNQGMNEMLTGRNQPLSEISQVRGMTGNVNNPNFYAPGQVDVGMNDVAGIAGNYQTNANNMAMNNANNQNALQRERMGNRSAMQQLQYQAAHRGSSSSGGSNTSAQAAWAGSVGY